MFYSIHQALFYFGKTLGQLASNVEQFANISTVYIEKRWFDLNISQHNVTMSTVTIIYENCKFTTVGMINICILSVNNLKIVEKSKNWLIYLQKT